MAWSGRYSLATCQSWQRSSQRIVNHMAIKASTRRLTTGLLALTLSASLIGAAVPANAAEWTWDAPGWGWDVVDGSTGGTAVIYTSPYGEHTVPGTGYEGNTFDFAGTHGAYGGGRGALGYPRSTVVPQGFNVYLEDRMSGAYQIFERGVVYGSDFGTYALLNNQPTTAVYNAQGGGGGTAGYPVESAVQQAPGWWYLSTSNATIYTSPRGGFAVTGEADVEHIFSQGGGGGAIGYPTGPRRVDAPGYSYQTFERGVIYCNPSGACWTVKGGFLKHHSSQGGGTGWLGYPVDNEYYEASEGFWFQEFERGFVVIFDNGRVVYY